ncbi:uncharacterized protein TM35_000081600 [Trypanosoma theileri]|uniref:Pre-mRNA-splicing factor Syf1-like N-terminal HAT-repeats domain-containing protein n=1 Tax=Trypanosoma theileri TaxID=67003 RepID=A0A1X0P0C5_9TRYP|nr:uncharacterized protein TM35_000081600 [Trypanosoma theileri]ORC90362.1 hypothetical protein TM35_000081600 [Trypanosoma theileri]
MKRGKHNREYMGPADAALRRRSVFRDARAATTQLTASQLIEQAQDMQRLTDPGNDSTKVVINSAEELALYRQKTRAELEERVKRGYSFLGNWVKYARWEAQQKDFVRMRSVLERAVAIHGTSPALWRDYAELEEEHGFVNHARAVWDRGVTALPSATDLWLKYLVFEQAAGQDSKVRDIFNRWLSGPTPPHCAWELFVLFEAQCQRNEACRDVMRRYVETYATVEEWLFYGMTELNVLNSADRAIKVFMTAMESLPEEYINGEKDCRIPLALAEALVSSKKYEEARDVYHRLLRDCKSASVLDKVFAAYSRFERLYGDGSNYETVAVAVAKAMYQQRILRDPTDFDAHVSQYLILRDAAIQSSKKYNGNNNNNDNMIIDTNEEALWKEALKCLEIAIGIRINGVKNPLAAQRKALLVIEYARRVECYDVNAARTALATCIREFPFTTASCPQLWIEAAALEQRHGAYAQGRKILGAAIHISACPDVFEAALLLEEKACVAGELSRSDCMQRSREIYQSAIKQFPQDYSLWEGYAKMEEKEEQFHRADALRLACIRSFTAAARAAQSMSDRYEVLGKVDQAWARRLAMKRRMIRAEQKKLQNNKNNNNNTVAKESTEKEALLQLYRDLLDSVWDDYKYEALRWREKAEATSGVLSPPPERIPDVLAPAVARFAEAVSAVASFLIVPTQRNGVYDAASVDWMRTVFRTMVERERSALQQQLGGMDENAGFDAVQQRRRWGEFLLNPVVAEWRRFEATYATEETLKAVQEFVQPAKRRTRLFAKRKA